MKLIIGFKKQLLTNLDLIENSIHGFDNNSSK